VALLPIEWVKYAVFKLQELDLQGFALFLTPSKYDSQGWKLTYRHITDGIFIFAIE
jgi:hypothetical protein